MPLGLAQIAAFVDSKVTEVDNLRLLYICSLFRKSAAIKNCKKVCYRWLHSAPRVKRTSFLLGLAPLGPGLRERGHPGQNVDTVR